MTQQDTNQDISYLVDGGYRNDETRHTDEILNNNYEYYELLQDILKEKIPGYIVTKNWARMDKADKLKDIIAEHMHEWINAAQKASGNNPIMEHLLTHAFEAIDFYQIIKFNELKFFESESD